MIPNYEPAVRGAAARLAPVRNQMDARGYDREDYEQELRLKAALTQQRTTESVQKPLAYVHCSIRNAEISFGRKHAVGVAHYAPFDDYDLANEDDGERAHAFAEIITLLSEHFTSDEMEQLGRATAQVSTGQYSRTTEYRHNVALLKKMRNFLESEGISAKLLGFTEVEDEVLQAPSIKFSLAKPMVRGHIFQQDREHASCACFSQLAPEVSKTEQVPHRVDKLCGTVIGHPVMQLEDGTILELPLTPRANQPWVKRKRHQRDRARIGWEHDIGSTLWAPDGVLEASPRKAGTPKGGGSPGGGNGTAGGGGSGRSRKAAPGTVLCIACEGSGKSTNGYPCSPCKGTGAARTAEHQFPDEQHPTVSGSADRQTDLFASQASRLNGVGGAHVPSALVEGGDALAQDSGVDAGSGDHGRVEGTVVSDDPAGWLLRGNGPDFQQLVDQQSGDSVRDRHGDNGGQAASKPEGERAVAPDERLQRGEVLPPVEKPAARAGPDDGYMVDLTTMVITRVDWKNVVPLVRTAEGYDVLQLNYWSPDRNAWVWLVAQHTHRVMPAGVVEVTPDEWLAFDRKFFAPGQTPFPLYLENWKSHATPIVETSKGPIHQVTYWEGHIQKWVVVTQQALAQVADGVLNLTFDQFFRMLRNRVAGQLPRDAYIAAHDNTPF